MPNNPGKYCRNRLFEWTMAAAMCAIALVLGIWPSAMEETKLRYMLENFDGGALLAAYALVGLLRVLALYLNSAWLPMSSLLRAICAIAGALIWFQMGFALVQSQFVVGAPPPVSAPVYFCLVIAEVISAYRAARDVRAG